MRRLLVLAVVAATTAFADVAPIKGCPGDRALGDSCATKDGTAGTCVYLQSEYICTPGGMGVARPWIGAGLAFIALFAGIATRRAFRKKRPT